MSALNQSSDLIQNLCSAQNDEKVSCFSSCSSFTLGRYSFGLRIQYHVTVKLELSGQP